MSNGLNCNGKKAPLVLTEQEVLFLPEIDLPIGYNVV